MTHDIVDALGSNEHLNTMLIAPTTPSLVKMELQIFSN